jgi:hypothetical protein
LTVTSCYNSIIYEGYWCAGAGQAVLVAIAVEYRCVHLSSAALLLPACPQVNQMCEYLSELCLVDVTTNKHSLSLLSAAVLHVALTALGRADTYPRTLARHARYKLEEVLPAAR